MKIIDWIEDNKELFTDTSDYIWAHPEIKFKEYKASERLATLLKPHGFDVQVGVYDLETAFVASYGSGEPVIGFLAEYDALDGMSQVGGICEKEVDHTTNYGHGCGHHLLGSASVMAAIALKQLIDDKGLSGTLKVYGCPAEEGGSGKTIMVKAGAFDDLDVAITWHPGTVNAVFTMKMLANIQCYFRFKGVSAHAAAAPHLGRSALDSVELMNIGVNYLREHIIPEARVHYAVTNTGGISPNVVQAEAEVLYLIRAPKISEANAIYDRVKKIAEGAALMSGTAVEVIFDKACSDVVPNTVLADIMCQEGQLLDPIDYDAIDHGVAEEMLACNPKINAWASLFDKTLTEEQLRELQEPLFSSFIGLSKKEHVIPGSSDVGDVSWNIPTVQCMTACYPQNTAPHSWQMVALGQSGIAHKGMLQAAKIMAMTGHRILNDSEIIVKAKAELLERLKGQPYVSPMK